jgi:hypothetical protein
MVSMWYFEPFIDGGGLFIRNSGELKTFTGVTAFILSFVMTFVPNIVAFYFTGPVLFMTFPPIFAITLFIALRRFFSNNPFVYKIGNTLFWYFSFTIFLSLFLVSELHWWIFLSVSIWTYVFYILLMSVMYVLPIVSFSVIGKNKKVAYMIMIFMYVAFMVIIFQKSIYLIGTFQPWFTLPNVI